MVQLLALARDGHRIELVDLPEGEHRVIITETGLHPDGIVRRGSTIYWTTMGRRTGTNSVGEALYEEVDGGVHAIEVGGTGRRDLVPPGSTTTGKQLACDSGGNLYWGNREGFSLATVRTDGTGLRDLVKYDGSGLERDWIVGVAVDEANGHIYWSQKGSPEGGDGGIYRAGLEIPQGQSAETRDDIERLWAELPAPIDLEIADGHVFWTDRGRIPGGDSLNRAPIPPAGESGQQPQMLADAFQDPIGLAVDAKRELAYVADLGGRIWLVPGPSHTDVATHVVVDMGFALTGLNLVQTDLAL